MQHLDLLDLFVDAQPAATFLSTADYVRLLHPPGARGKATIMSILDAETTWSRTLPIDELPFVAESVLDESSYISLHRFYGPRRSDRLAALNSLYLDLDFHRMPEWAGKTADSMAGQLESDLAGRGIPQPSVLIDTGRGLAAVWLLHETSPKARPRWQGCLKALIDLHRGLGADPACSDVSRVFRVPGSVNGRNGRTVQVIGGSLVRYEFDGVADAIYRAAGRPTREQFEQRRQRKEVKSVGEPRPEATRPRGLTPAARFRQILRDLDRVRQDWGGTVPEGQRNSWLHVYATCLTHTRPVNEIAPAVEAMAAEATPGLSPGEVRSVIASARRRAEGARSCVPGLDGRLHYAGATLAERLGISDELARTLGLEQVYSAKERARRKAIRENERHRAQGAVPRQEYLNENNLSATKPWEAEGISRATWYRRRKAQAEAVQGPTEDRELTFPAETGPCPQLGGEATPKAQAEDHRSEALWLPLPKTPTPPTDPRKAKTPKRAAAHDFPEFGKIDWPSLQARSRTGSCPQESGVPGSGGALSLPFGRVPGARPDRNGDERGSNDRRRS